MVKTLITKFNFKVFKIKKNINSTKKVTRIDLSYICQHLPKAVDKKLIWGTPVVHLVKHIPYIKAESLPQWPRFKSSPVSLLLFLCCFSCVITTVPTNEGKKHPNKSKKGNQKSWNSCNVMQVMDKCLKDLAPAKWKTYFNNVHFLTST